MGYIWFLRAKLQNLSTITRCNRKRWLLQGDLRWLFSFLYSFIFFCLSAFSKLLQWTWIVPQKMFFKLLKTNPKVLRMVFGHECGLALFQADNDFLCYPFQVWFAFKPESKSCDSKESVVKEFRALSKPARAPVYCLPLPGSYRQEIQSASKSFPDSNELGSCI